MRVKQLLLPFALIVPILLALILITPSSTQELFREPSSAPSPEPMVALTSVSTSSISVPVSNAQVPLEDFDPVLAVTLLSEVALDENDQPLVNDQLKHQLDNAVRLIGRERSPSDLDKLNEVIKQAFKPETAQSINHILFQYYAYKTAEEDYTRGLNPQSNEESSYHAKTLSDLRESYLGSELAGKLFGQENIYQNFMAELTTRLSVTDLSDDARSTITAEVRKKYYPDEAQTSGL
jgi:hypothetical protein